MILAQLIIIGILTLFLTIRALRRQRYPDVPTLKLSTHGGRWGEMEDAQLFVNDCMKLFKVGYERYSKHGLHYLLPTPKEKQLVVAPQFFEEIYRAPDDVVSAAAANTESMQFKWTLEERLFVDHWHIDSPLAKLTKSLGPRLRDIVDEGKHALSDNISLADDWMTVDLLQTSLRIVTRTANRLLFGIDLARDENFLQLSIDYTTIMFGGAELIKNYPNFLKTPMLRWKTPIQRAQAAAARHLVPIFEHRLSERQRYTSQGNEEQWNRTKPNDCIQWVLDAIPPGGTDMRSLTLRMLHINIAAAHTSTVHYLEAICVLSLMPEVQRELREEIKLVLGKEGWTKQCLTHLAKLDSFMTESARFCSLTASKLKRLVTKDWRLSDGTLIPKGTTLYVNHVPYVFDQEIFEDPQKFDHLRMYHKRQEPGQENMHQFVMASALNQTFGCGKHACPGRFFAANEIKILIVLTLMAYDIRMKSNVTFEEISRGVWHNEFRFPLPGVLVDFKKRKETMPKDVEAVN